MHHRDVHVHPNQTPTTSSSQQSRSSYKCLEGCELSYSKCTDLRSHLKIVHNQCHEVEELAFATNEEYTSWLHSINNKSLGKYVLAKGITRTKTAEKIYLHCSQSGKLGSAQSIKNTEHLKIQASCKINSNLCTSQMYITKNIADGTYNVTYFKNHYGHELKPQHVEITNEDRQNIVSMLMQSISSDRLTTPELELPTTQPGIKITSLKKKMHNCTVCKRNFTQKTNLYVHMRKVHKKEPLIKPSLEERKKTLMTCEHCEKKFTTKITLSKHKKTHHPYNDHDYNQNRKPRLICPEKQCKKYFPSFKQLRTHLLADHNIKIEYQQLSFDSAEEFLQWKKKYESQKFATYCLGHRYHLITGEIKQLYYCHRSFQYLSKSTGKRNIKNIGTNKIGKACPSFIEATVSCCKQYKVIIWTTHVGHSCEVGRVFLNKETRAEIAGKLFQGVSFQRVLDDTRQSKDKEDQREYLLTKQDLRNITRDFNITYSTRRHQNDAISVRLWVDEMKKLGGDDCPVLFYKEQGENHDILSDDDFALVLMTKFQSKQLKKFGHDKICIDGTHGTNAYKFHLFSLVTVNEYGSGCPVAFMFSNRSDETIFKVFFSMIKTHVGTINSNIFMSDDAPAFYNAWSAVMGSVPHRLLCSWHVIHNWRKQLCKINGGFEKKKIVFNSLRTLLQLTSVDKFETCMAQIVNDLFSDPDTLEYGKYFENIYSKRPMLWAYCYRLRLGINTNMYLESLHKVLKYIYLGGKKVKRLDKTIDAVMKIARDTFFNRMTKIAKHTPTEKLRRVQKSHKDSQSIEIDTVETLSVGQWLVHSQSASVKYHVFKENEPCHSCTIICKECSNICIHDYICTCLDNLIKHNICKHIHACVQLSRNSGENIKAIVESGANHELHELLNSNFPTYDKNQSTLGKSENPLVKKSELLTGLLLKARLDSEESRLAEKLLDKLINIANKNSISFTSKTSENINTNQNLDRQIRFYPTQKSKAIKMNLKTPTQAEKNDIIESLLLNETKERLNIHTSFDHTYI